MSRELLKEILEWYKVNPSTSNHFDYLMDAVEAELAKPEPEPLAWMNKDGWIGVYKQGDANIPLYATPPDQSARIELLEQRLKAVHAEIEPVAWMIVDKDFNCMGFLPFKEKDTIPVYTTPPDQSARIAELEAELAQAYKTVDENWVGHQQLAALQAKRDLEPIAYITGWYGGYPTIKILDGTVLPNGTALYTVPQERKPLTDEELDTLRQGQNNLNFVTLREFRVIARAVEKQHGTKSLQMKKVQTLD